MRTNHRLLRHTAVSLVLAVSVVPMATFGENDIESRARPRLQDQLTEFSGGCPPFPSDHPRGCIDVQFSVHRAPVCTNGPNVTFKGYSISTVRQFGDLEPLAGGSSTLVRTADGVAFNLSTTNLARHSPYTVWFVGFDPDNKCIVSGPECTCGEADIDSVFYATGAITDRLGSATFIGNAKYGELPDRHDQVPFEDFEKPLKRGSEIHLVVRAHGRALKRGSSRWR